MAYNNAGPAYYAQLSRPQYQQQYSQQSQQSGRQAAAPRTYDQRADTRAQQYSDYQSQGYGEQGYNSPRTQERMPHPQQYDANQGYGQRPQYQNDPGGRQRRDDYDRRPPPNQRMDTNYSTASGPSQYQDQRKAAPNTKPDPRYAYADGGFSRPPQQQNVYQQPEYANSMPAHLPHSRQAPLQSSHSSELPRPGTQQGQHPRQRPPPLDRSFSDDRTDPRIKPARRPLIEPVSPTYLPQDNAFPVFPTKKSPAKNDKTREENSGRGSPPKARPPLTNARSNSYGNDQGYQSGQPASRSPPMGPGSRPTNGHNNRSSPPAANGNHASPPVGHGNWASPPFEPNDRPSPSMGPSGQFSPPMGPGSRPSPRMGPAGQFSPPMGPGSRPSPNMAPSGQFSPPMGPGSRPSPPQQQNSLDNFDLSIRTSPPGTHRDGPRRGHRKTQSQSEVYAVDYINDIGRVPFSPEMDRDARIEAEMPNFDEAGPRYDSGVVTGAREGGYADGQNYSNGPHRPGFQNQNGPGGMRSVSDPRAAMSNGIRGPHPANQPPAASQWRDQYAPRDGPNMRGNGAMSADAGYGPRPVPQRPGTADDYNGGNLRRQDPYGGSPGYEPQRVPSAPPQMTNGRGPPPKRAQSNNSGPDSLPHHPVPVRPGLLQQQQQQQRQPPTPTSAGHGSGTVPRTSLDSRRSSVAPPVTHAEINQLQSLVNAHPQDAVTALLLAKKLVEAANVLASDNGRLDARATAKNREKYIFDAHRRVKKLVASGNAEAMFYLADCYGAGSLGLEEDPKEAFNLYQQAAKLGHPEAAYRTAVCCEMGPEEGGGIRRDVQKAVQWYKRAAQLQDPAAMYKLGVICLKGLLSQPKNVVEAERWLKRAAERADRDHPHAIHELALMYETEQQDRDIRGKIVPDDAYAKELFFKAAKMGFKNSQFRLGQAYEYGALGLPIDARNSIAWYSKAAAQGEHGAELALSGWYLTGAEGILENSDTEAYLWARKAASADPPLPKAMFALGYYAETGIGCPVNIEEAKRWYGRAASYKFAKAIDRLEDIRRNGGKAPKELKGQRLQRKDLKEKVR